MCVSPVLTRPRAPPPAPVLQHILASGRFSHLSRCVCCPLIRHQPSGYQTKEGRGHVLCSLGISLRIPNLAFLQGSEVWATEEVGEANPPLGGLNLEDLGELTGFQDALKLSAGLCLSFLFFVFPVARAGSCHPILRRLSGFATPKRLRVKCQKVIMISPPATKRDKNTQKFTCSCRGTS